ncbi:MAG: di-trans,poly-cis-decaprenylcistransferase [Rhodocyclaceae bacterium]|nr:di-trans,poly-cis-decaprenylcistransferase [Rhodocyclaceae bacterium]
MTDFGSSTKTLPQTSDLPRHIAIIMDGNGRWARKRLLPRAAGHKAGLGAVRAVVKGCAERGVRFVTLFAFSSENWRRPAAEVGFLTRLFLSTLDREVDRLHRNNVRFRAIGAVEAFGDAVVARIHAAEALTAGNTGLTLTIAANYGGRWDILQAVERLRRSGHQGPIDEAALGAQLSMAYAPEPDLFVRTGGEARISNFLLWQLAYTEFHFTDTLWPDFDEAALAEAIASYARRERRFGRTSEQLQQSD